MTDQTTRNLAREVAEAIGYKVVTGYFQGSYENYADLIALDGSKIVRVLQSDYPGYGAENAAWDNAPDYSHDLNDCARDLTREGWEFHLGQNLTRVWWKAEYSNGMESISAKDENPAVAWCKSFLALDKYIKESNHD